MRETTSGDLDEAQAEAFRRGDQRALRHLYDQYAGVVFRQAVRALSTRADAEDVTQATFVAAWLARRTFEPARGSLPGWLLGIARRQAVDQLRARGRQDRVTESLQARPASPAPATDPDRLVDRLLVAEGLAALPAGQRQALEAAFYQQLSHQQIATVTGQPLGTVKSQIRRGLATLKGRWERDGLR